MRIHLDINLEGKALKVPTFPSLPDPSMRKGKGLPFWIDAGKV